MELKIVETSLNLRVEKRLGKTNNDYVLAREVALEQLKLNADVYCNVEYMECNDSEYMNAFDEAGYMAYKGVDAYNRRGIMYMVKKEYPVQILQIFEEPHMMHIRIEKDGNPINILTVRILVSGSNDEDFICRKEQWDKVLNYIDNLEGRENLCITGDFNHGVISDTYRKDQARRFFNYQMVVDSLKKKKIALAPIEGMSYMGYMKIDHIAVSENLSILGAEYEDAFGPYRKIGVPDHSMIVARVATA